MRVHHQLRSNILSFFLSSAFMLLSLLREKKDRRFCFGRIKEKQGGERTNEQIHMFGWVVYGWMVTIISAEESSRPVASHGRFVSLHSSHENVCLREFSHLLASPERCMLQCYDCRTRIKKTSLLVIWGKPYMFYSSA